jgi:tRNA(Ile)-lysidine synthase
MAVSRKQSNADPLRAVERFLDERSGTITELTVGLSGGLDSIVLLDVLHRLAPLRGIALRAIHVHHGLSPNADTWAAHCRRLCRGYGISLRVRHVRVTRVRGTGLEASARRARYQAFAGERRAGMPATIALAHHQDDQAETLLHHLLRGTGVAGAAGMSADSTRGEQRILRPLLGVSRGEIATYAQRRGLAWVDDESNADRSLTRNWLRREVAPILAARFPRWTEAFARAAAHFGREKLEAASVLRGFLKSQGLRAPPERHLAEILRQLTDAGRDAQVELRHDGSRIRRHRGAVHVVAPPPELCEMRPVRWSGESRVPLPAGLGELRFRRSRGLGIDAGRLGERPVVIRWRTGGERFQVSPDRPRRALKKILQEAGVPPWERSLLPLVYCGDDLIWVGRLGADAAFAASREGAGLRIEWRSRVRSARPSIRQ